MVSEFALGAIIAGTSTAVGSLGTAYIQMHRAKMEQQGEDKRLIAQYFAAQKAECIQELGYQLNNCQRIHFEALGKPARHNLSEEDYRTHYKHKCKDISDCYDRSVIHLSEKGENELSNYIGHLVDAENYLIRKKAPESQLEYREGDLSELIRTDSPEFDFEEWLRDYEYAKNALRNDISDRMDLLSTIEYE